MYKSLAGIAAAAALTVIAVPTAPANAAPIQNAPGIAEHQSGVEQVQYRRYNRRVYRGYYGPRRYGYYGGGPYVYGGYGPYAYAPYAGYRRYYAPRPYVGIGPFGFGVW